MEKKKLLQYLENIDKLLEEHTDWFFSRFEAVQKESWNKANTIEQVYLNPLEKKIKKLAEIILEELRGKNL